MKRTFLILILLISLLSLFSADAYAENEDSWSYAPDINVYFSNAKTGSANANTDAVTKIKAKVVYEGCAEGNEYVLVLMLKDASSATVCTFPNGSGALRHTFKAEGKAGVFEFEFELNAVAFSGKTLAEIHYLEGMESYYSDKIDESSGRIYVPRINTNAVSKNGDKTVLAGKNAEICDVVSYRGLAPEEEYRLVTGLKDSQTGELIRGSDGNPVSAVSSFTPTKANGKIATRITADLRKYGGMSVTLYEEVYAVTAAGNPVLLLSNRFADDEGGTVLAGLTEISISDKMYRTPIAGVSITVTSESDGTNLSGISDEDGKCTFPLDADVTYYCTVNSAPEDYNIRSDAVELVPAYTEGESALTILLLKKNAIVLFRTDAESGLPIQGLVTAVYDANGRILAKMTSDKSGEAYFDAEEYCEKAAKAANKTGEDGFVLTLTFEDSATPTEYYPKETAWTVSIDDKSNITGSTELRSVRRVPVSVTVVNSKKEGIPGVEFAVIGVDGIMQGRAITDHEGKIYLTPQRTGSYTLFETEVPSGYVRSLKEKHFTVGEDGSVSGDLIIALYSEDFTNGVTAVAIITAAFLAVLLSAGLLVRKGIQKKIDESAAKSGKHKK